MKPFQLFTDNQGVTYLKSKAGLSKREARWVEFLADFDVEIIHCAGRENMADALSRVDSTPETPLSETESGGLMVTRTEIQASKDFNRWLAKGYKLDKKMCHIIKRLKKNPGSCKQYRWDSAQERLYLISGERERLCIPYGKLRADILRWCHDESSAGHPGRERTYSRISRDYYWPRLGREVARFVKSCRICQHHKGDKPQQAPLQSLPIPKQPWEEISMDFITGLPESQQGNNTILTFVDRLTKQAHFVATTATLDAKATADLYVQAVFRHHGLSRSITSDRDPRFTSKVYGDIFKQLGVELKLSTANHPETDGQTERVHRTIEQILRTVVNHRRSNWEELLPICEFAYNDMVGASTGETPFFLNHGHHPVTVDLLLSAPLSSSSSEAGSKWLESQREAVMLVKDSIQGALDKQMYYADQHRREAASFNEGEKVLVHRDFMSTPASREQGCAKLAPRWFGPFEISELISERTVRLKLPPFCRAHPVFNVAALKPYCEDGSFGKRRNPPAPIIDLDGQERYIVEAVLNQRNRRGKVEYLVKWLGFNESTWEPEEFLLDESGQKIVPLRQFLDKHR